MLVDDRDDWENLFHSISDAVVVLDLDHRILDANRIAVEMLRRPRAEIVGSYCFELFHRTNCPPSQCPHEKLIASNRPETVDMEIETLGGTYMVTVAPVVDCEGSISKTLHIAKDISDRKAAERERESLIAELETKNAELERFAYTVSHELNTPLITINGYLGLLEEDVTSGDIEQVRADISRITHATQTMHELLKGVLELARMGHKNLAVEKIPPRELVDEALAMLADRIANRGVEVEVADELPFLMGDRPRLLEVLQNLIENAVKYMGDQPHPKIEIGSRDDEVDSIFFVRDNGIGIAHSYQTRVFDLFDQLDPHSEGSGAGLAIVKRIIEKHQGRVWFESDGLGHGASCCFTLPQEKTMPRHAT